MELTPMNLYTKVRVLKGVPFDSSYREVCDGYTNADNQANVISSGRTKYSYDNCSPIRLQNAIRLPVCADFIYDCNYIMWQNANFGTKWFYGFITKIDWININCCHVHYELDVWNTWYFSTGSTRGWEMEQSFVEREHTNDDTIGANLVPENLETGEYVWNGEPKWSHYSRDINGDTNLCIGILSTMWLHSGSRFDDYFGKLYKNVFSGLNVHLEQNSAVVESILTEASQQSKTDGIKSIFMCPRQFYDASQPNHTNIDGVVDEVITWNLPITINGYGRPKNNKLLTYPYSFFHITNNQGNCGDYRFEYFSHPNDITFRSRGSLIDGIPEFIMYPTSYKGQTYNLDEKVTLSNFPVCSWVSDTFWDWYSINKANVASGILSGAVGMMGGIQSNVIPSQFNYMNNMSNTYNSMRGSGPTDLPLTTAPSVTGGVTQSGLQSAVSVGNIIGNTYIKSTLPPTAHGTPSATTQTAFGFTDYTYGDMTIKPQFAKIIDDYFSRFGYATHLTKTPNMQGRANWNYVKTVQCSINSKNMSLDDAHSLEQMFNSGITIWHNINNIGNYSLDNPIV